MIFTIYDIRLTSPRYQVELDNTTAAWELAEKIWEENTEAVKVWDMPRDNGAYAVRVAAKEQTIFIIEKS
jgi:hypothetical protein